MESINEDLDLYKPLAYQSGLFFKIDIPQFYLKHLIPSLVTKLSCIYYVSVSTHPFSILVSDHIFLFKWTSCTSAYLFIIFVSENIFTFKFPSRDCAYLFIIFVFQHISGFFQWLYSHLGNIFIWNLFSNTLLACIWKFIL